MLQKSIYSPQVEITYNWIRGCSERQATHSDTSKLMAGNKAQEEIPLNKIKIKCCN